LTGVSDRDEWHICCTSIQGQTVIDTYFKEHFWTFYLLVIAIAGFLVGQVVSTYAREALRGSAEVTAAPAARVIANNLDKNKSIVPTRAFLDKNIFKAEREDLAPVPDPTNADAQDASASMNMDGDVDTSNCEKASLSVNLVATIVSRDETRSVAVFVNPAKKQPGAYRIKDKLLDKAEIIRIEWRRVLISNQGRCEMFSLEEPGKKKKSRSAPAAKADTRAPKVKIGNNIKKLSDTEYEIPKEEIENVLGNLNVIATQARIVPSFRNGKANGFKLFSIRPGSLYSKIGIQNGDVIQKINGYEMNSPDKALEIYGKLKDASSITVDLVRRGRTKTLSYGIR
jgi:general secretion pathway protein C